LVKKYFWSRDILVFLVKRYFGIFALEVFWYFFGQEVFLVKRYFGIFGQEVFWYFSSGYNLADFWARCIFALEILW
jgi:hypothetical protein